MKSKEERFIELIGDYSINITIDGYFTKILFFDLRGNDIIDYNVEEGKTWMGYYKFWSIFEEEYKMDYYETQLFFKEMLLKYFKIKNTMPIHYNMGKQP